MKVLLTGRDGQLGREICFLAKEKKITLDAFNKSTLDIRKPYDIKDAIRQCKPDYIINAAAYTAVDQAEIEYAAAYASNALGVYYLALAAREANIPLLHISSDYVFDGKKAKTGYYTEKDKTNPLSNYGQSKLAGERFIQQICKKYIILRISWVFSEYGNNFLKTILRHAKQKESLEIVCDQWGGPTHARAVAETLFQIIQYLEVGNKSWGVYHYSGLPMVSWHQFADFIIDQAKTRYTLRTEVVLPILTKDYSTPAIRPFNSQLSCKKIKRVFNIMPNTWRKGVIKVLDNTA